MNIARFILANNLHETSSRSLKLWWRHQTETFYTLLALCEENSPVTCEFDVFFDLRLNTRLSKQILTPVKWDATMPIMTLL